MTWNTSVPAERRFAGKMTPGRSGSITHVVCHITGTDSFDSVRNAFTSQDRSAHYVVDKQEVVFQFVEEENQAWHAGIQGSVQALYQKPPADWRKYLFYFDWDKSYPADSIFLDNSGSSQAHTMPVAIWK